MIRKNVANQTVYLPQLRLTADGSAVTAAASLVVAKDGVEAAAAGTLAHYAGGIWKYTPTQSETNCAIMALVLTATGADTVLLNILTTAANPQDATAFGIGNLDGTISSRSSQTSVDTLAGYVDTEVAAIKAKTDNLPTDPADASDIAASFGTVNSTLATIAGYIDTEVAAIKAKTDNLPTDPADASDIAASFGTVNSTLATIAGYIDTEVAAIKAKTDNLPASPAAVSDIPTTSAIATAVAATQALSRLDSMIESDGGGQFRFDTIALSMGAGGGGGGTDWTSDERTAIRSILGVPTSGTTPTDPTVGILDTIRDTVGSIGLNVYPVSASTPERVSGTTLTFYLDESRSVSIATDFTLTSMTLEFTVEDSRGNDVYVVGNGSITRASQTATVPITTAVTGSLGQYAWSLRDITTGNSVIARGVLSVQNAASND